jgi:hypothetical protein
MLHGWSGRTLRSRDWATATAASLGPGAHSRLLLIASSCLAYSPQDALLRGASNSGTKLTWR